MTEIEKNFYNIFNLGAYFKNNGNTVFRLFTFSDTEKVVVEVKSVQQPIKCFELNKVKKCIWELELESGEISEGDRYRFVITRNGKVVTVKDPCSMYQDSYFKWSILYNHNNFKWNDEDWTNGLNNRRVSRLSSFNNMSCVDDLRIYELHIGTFTDEGTFHSAKSKLKKISEELNFNAIEIMPVENTYSFNWGYDGVDKFAPNHTYGTPDNLKELIDYAHSCGLNVIMDIVPNHLGPDIATLHQTGPYIEGVNCFGYKFNYEADDDCSIVRDFIVGSALNWVLNYHCDGLRVDMTKFMCSDYTMKQMVAQINYYAPDAFMIAEDGRDNDSRVTRPFPQIEVEANQCNHSKFINQIKSNDVSLSSLGFDTEWDFPFHKQIASSILGSWDCRIKNLVNFDQSLTAAQTRVKYPMSHDEIGNIDGTRLISKIMANKLKLNDRICECCHSLKCKIAAHAAHNILVALLDGSLEKMTNDQRLNFYKKNSLIFEFSIDDIKKAYIQAVNMHKLAIAKIYSIPGPKMIFQGDESANISYFKFFRKFSTGPEPYLRDKGYEPGMPAFFDSKLSAVKVCEKYSYINNSVETFVADLNKLCDDNIALSSGNIEKTFINEAADTHAIHCRRIYNEIFSISNFSSQAYLKNFGLMFPKGKWREIFNSDEIKYAGEGIYLNSNQIKDNYSYISLPAYGVIFFEKII